ncbi:hypothetical protein EX30DRAFT_344530 [Ascodesmis nigricans]|uniref:Uncharacterized protein n=1 Tax=Ascodesmis nigricans TaxID=341454 RepID=A0A4S2MJ48_9PEZI|nr:hypothetical protein EX30DRAFT_344530 [Ascodesmis nigricans]
MALPSSLPQSCSISSTPGKTKADGTRHVTSMPRMFFTPPSPLPFIRERVRVYPNSFITAQRPDCHGWLEQSFLLAIQGKAGTSASPSSGSFSGSSSSKHDDFTCSSFTPLPHSSPSPKKNFSPVGRVEYKPPCTCPRGLAKTLKKLFFPADCPASSPSIQQRVES